MKKYSTLLAFFLMLSSVYSAHAEDTLSQEDQAEVKQLVKFITSSQVMRPAKKAGGKIPLSYSIGTYSDPAQYYKDIAKYFGDLICVEEMKTIPGGTCNVVDHMYYPPFAVLGMGLPKGTKAQLVAAQRQIERTDMAFGADVYDAATWQVALALAASKGYYDKAAAIKNINDQLDQISDTTSRATGDEFKYGYVAPIKDKTKAFAFRMIATDFRNDDPFCQAPCTKGKEDVPPANGTMGKYLSFDTAQNQKGDKENDPASFFYQKPEYRYATTWSDWKPITGENAWALLVGPLQASLLVPDDALSKRALDNAVNSLYAFSAMQAGIGAFYYAPLGSLGNEGAITEAEISLENNFSVLGGLQILDRILAKTDPSGTSEPRKMIKTMLYGGKTVHGYETIGLLSFLFNGAYDKTNNKFYTHGSTGPSTNPRPSLQNNWKPVTSSEPASNAVDVNTWGISALGPETIDSWFGDGAAYRIWKTVETKGGYKNGGTIWGVGYTLSNANDKIMSTEWTAGAISAVKSLINYYSKKHVKEVDVGELTKVLASMEQGIQNLRNDKYLSASVNFDKKTSSEYFVTVPESDGYAYLYASKRWAIPFGWNANTLPSLTSNAWVIMNKLGYYNPFQYQGKLEGENYPKPAQKDISGGGGGGGNLPKAVTVNFSVDPKAKAGILNYAISYHVGKRTNWVDAFKCDKSGNKCSTFEGTATFPADTSLISVAINRADWPWHGACQVNPPTQICQEGNCDQPLNLVFMDTNNDGTGACQLKPKE